MIFKTISKLKNKNDIKFFIEKIDLYIKLVSSFCKKNRLSFYNLSAQENIQELKEIGVIETKKDLEILKKILKNTYETFIKSVNFANLNKKGLHNLLDNLYNSKRLILQKHYKSENQYTLIDFFCGAGGLSLGFIQEGFHIKLANDIDDVCIETYKYNHPYLPSNKIIKDDIKHVIKNIKKYINTDIDIVIGGPPCQGFSSANKNHRVINDPRNELYKYYLKAIEKIAPKFVVMENVKGMLKVANQVVEDYENIKIKRNGKTYKYNVNYKVLNSENFSVAQSRERLIYIAIRNDIQQKYKVTPEKVFDDIQNFCKNKKIYNLRDALDNIKMLKAPTEKNMNEIDSDISGKKVDINTFNNNDYLNLINQGRNIQFIYNHKARFLSKLNFEIYKRLNQGDDASNDKIKDIMPYKNRLHCFKDKYFKLYADKPCRTITAHLRMDCHSHIHPFQVRALTPREAARVQSFPDDYIFLGPYLKTYMQIGNAVPPMMARGIAHIIKKYL